MQEEFNEKLEGENAENLSATINDEETEINKGQPETESEDISGSLFDTINYKHPDDITRWLDKMTQRDAMFAIISAAAYGHKKGIYNLLESEAVSKAIRLITTPPKTE